MLSANVVHDLGASFCNIEAAKLTDEKLNAKANKKGAVGKGAASKAKPTKPKPYEDGPDDGVQAKKSKKSKK